MKILDLNHVALHVKALGPSLQFYGEVLALPALSRPAFDFPGAWFRIGTQHELHLIEGRLAEPLAEGRRAGHFALQVEDIEAAEASLKTKGVSFNGPFRRPDGALQIFLQDPDGHTVELCDLSHV